MKSSSRLRLAAAAGLFALACQLRADPPVPRLVSKGEIQQLEVDGKPFLILGGELGNSIASNPDTLRPSWAKFRELHLNTVIAPVYWDLIEPQEGRYDFSTVDRLIEDARSTPVRLVLLWFGSWKNSMSCYAPGWVKTDTTRFPRACDADLHAVEILSPFCEANRTADSRAFAALMKHLSSFDAAHRTVILVQVENEIGMLPCARDHSVAANHAFDSQVPEALMRALQAPSTILSPEVRSAWEAAGRKSTGTWEEVFGKGQRAEEIFMAWFFARYTEAVAAAGKAEYPLPLYVNAALIRPGYQPGQYPSAGPLPHLFEVWKAGAPSIDFLSPDIYHGGFVAWASRYHRRGNPVFIPESVRTTEASVNGFYAFGSLDAIGFSPFGIDEVEGPAARLLAQGFDTLGQLSGLILAHQGDGSMAGLLLEGSEELQPKQLALGGYTLHVTFERGSTLGTPDGAVMTASPEAARSNLPAGGLVIAESPNHFIVAGTGITVTFEAPGSGHAVGILSDEEGRFTDGVWKNTLWLGGDQTNQGRHVRLESGRFSVQRVTLYPY